VEVTGQLHAPTALPPRERAPGTHWIGGSVGPRAGLDVVVKRKTPSRRRKSNPDHPTTEIIYVGRYGRTLKYDEMRKTRKEAIMSYFKVLSWNSSTMITENN
jgi:hypothetical protein